MLHSLTRKKNLILQGPPGVGKTFVARRLAYAFTGSAALEDGRKVEGILLYPTVSRTLDLDYVIQGHRIRVVTVDLNSHRTQIQERLLAIIN
jgi:MoxR-like ATPase